MVGSLGLAGASVLRPVTPTGSEPRERRTSIGADGERQRRPSVSFAPDCSEHLGTGAAGPPIDRHLSESATARDAAPEVVEAVMSAAKSAEPEPVAFVRRRGGNLPGRRLTVETKQRLIGDTIAKDKDGTGFSAKQHPAAAMQTPGMVLSVWGSATADEDKFEPYFAQKGINFDGEIQRIPHCIGLKSARGFKPESPNQDDFFVLARPDSLLLGVLDGHGPDGHTVAHFAQERLPTKIMERLRADGESWEEGVKSAVSDIVGECREELGKKAHSSGCTVTVAFMDRGSGPAESEKADTDAASPTRPMRLRTAYLGDSIAVHATRAKRPGGKGGQWDVTVLTDIHRPDRLDEEARILAAGGSVLPANAGCAGSPPRLLTPDYGLAMSRSFGDFHCASYGLSHEPEIGPCRELDQDLDHMILICSDGVWDVIPPPQAVAFVGKFRPEEAQLAVDRLVAKAQLRWQEVDTVVDDITAILVWPSLEEAKETVEVA